MIFLVIPLVFIAAFVVYQIYEWGFKGLGLDTLVEGFAIGIMGLLIVFLSCLVPMASDDPSYDNSILVMDEKVELIAVKDQFGLTGSGSLFLGYIDSEMKYIYIVEDEMLGMRIETVSPEKAYVKYIEPDEQPYVQRWHREHESAVFRWLFPFLKVSYETIYIPEGSIVEQVYEIDLE